MSWQNRTPQEWVPILAKQARRWALQHAAAEVQREQAILAERERRSTIYTSDWIKGIQASVMQRSAPDASGAHE